MIILKKEHKKKLFIGIDLGTTYSLLATIQNEKIVLLEDDQKSYLLPSAVHYQKNKISVGWDALKHILDDPQNTIVSVKRLLGRSIEFIKKNFPKLPYYIDQDKNKSVFFSTNFGYVTPISVSSDILMCLKNRSCISFEQEIDASIITVPAYFNNIQKTATKQAATLAKINLIRLLNEPTAAAIAYGLQKVKKGIIVVYDLGGGTFDVSILKLNKEVFEVLGTSGHSHLGGDDFDSALANYIFKKSNVSDVCNDFLQILLINIARETKIKLTKYHQVKVQFLKWTGYITRNELNSIIFNLVNKTLSICHLLLDDINLSLEQIEQVIMVGGSTRVPLVYQEVSKFFKKHPLNDINPDQVVAIGAAIQANMLMGKNVKNKKILLDVIPLSLGIEVMGGFVEKIILRNTAIPISKTKEFTTYKDNQTSILIHILQGERETVKDCISLSRFVLKNIEPKKAGIIRILVTFQVDTDGLIHIKVLEKNSNIEKIIQIDSNSLLQNIDISSMVQDYLKNSKQDYYFRMQVEKKMEAIRMLEILTISLKNNKHLISEDEFKKIKSKQNQLQKSIDQDDFFSIKINMKKLDEVSKKFLSLELKNAISSFIKKNTLKEVT